MSVKHTSQLSDVLDVIGVVQSWLGSDEVTPSPDGELQLLVRCYSDPEHKRSKRHSVTLHRDWTFETPHDLEAERVAAALGGYLSCLQLQDHVVPAVEAFVRRTMRADLPDIKRAEDGRWVVGRRVSTCCGATLAWRTPQEAAAHLRDLKHISHEFGAARGVVSNLAAQVLAAYGLTGVEGLPTEVRALSGQVVPWGGSARDLWEAGLSPARVVAMHAAVAATGPLPPSYFLAVVSRRPDLQWVRDTARAVPDRADESWLAWTETPQDREDKVLRQNWLSLGVARADIATLTGSAYDPHDVRSFARLIRTTTTMSGAVLASWVKAGVTPDLSTLARVCRVAPPGPLTLTAAAVDETANSLRRASWGCTRQEAAFVLTVCGSPAIAQQVVARAVSLEVADVLDALNDWNDRENPYSTRRSQQNA